MALEGKKDYQINIPAARLKTPLQITTGKSVNQKNIYIYIHT